MKGNLRQGTEAIVSRLVSERIASRIFNQDASVWGNATKSEAASRLGWVRAAETSIPLVPDVLALREEFLTMGLDRVLLAGMGGSSLAPGLIAKAAGVKLVIIDTSSPTQILEALGEEEDLRRTVLVVSSKSGTTIETLAIKRLFRNMLEKAGLDPARQIVIVTDPSSPLDKIAHSSGYRVFHADPNVGGRYSALTAYGVVPTGLAGVDIHTLLNDAAEASSAYSKDHPENAALLLAAIIGGDHPARNKLGIVSGGIGIAGLTKWIEQLVAESTGKDGKGVLPIDLRSDEGKKYQKTGGLVVVWLEEEANSDTNVADSSRDIVLSGSLVSQFLAWEFATAAAAYLMGVNPFDQPDVERSKMATRKILTMRDAGDESRTELAEIVISSPNLELEGCETVLDAIDLLLSKVDSNGYISVHGYVNQYRFKDLPKLRDYLALHSTLPITFEWGPQLLHTTGQYHKGGPRNGGFIQVLEDGPFDLHIPGEPHTFGDLIRSQAAGDRKVLSAQGLPVVVLTLKAGANAVLKFFESELTT